MYSPNPRPHYRQIRWLPPNNPALPNAPKLFVSLREATSKRPRGCQPWHSADSLPWPQRQHRHTVDFRHRCPLRGSKVTHTEYADILHPSILSALWNPASITAMACPVPWIRHRGEGLARLISIWVIADPIQAVRTLRIIDQRISLVTADTFSIPLFVERTKGSFGYFIDQHTVIAGDCNEIIPFSSDKHGRLSFVWHLHTLYTGKSVESIASFCLNLRSMDFLKELLRLLDGIRVAALSVRPDPIFQGIGRGKLTDAPTAVVGINAANTNLSYLSIYFILQFIYFYDRQSDPRCEAINAPRRPSRHGRLTGATAMKPSQGNTPTSVRSSRAFHRQGIGRLR